MEIIKGAYSSAHIFTTNNNQTALDPYAAAQLKMLCDSEVSKGCRIRVMPDVHPGKVGTIGLTMTVGERIMPSLTGIDIGCGMTLAEIRTRAIDGKKADAVIRECVPSGSRLRRARHRLADSFDFSALACGAHIRKEKALLGLGTLGGGNHFIEIGQDPEGRYYIVIHSGSRSLGKEAAEYYLDQGQKYLKGQGISLPWELTWLEGPLKEDYLRDMQEVQAYASLNRRIILDELAKGMKWKILDTYECIHNYVDSDPETLSLFGSPILRKGAVSAMKGQKVIIPVNMKEGILLGTGLGNTDWNCSAPHGSGRIMKREDVKKTFTVSAFKAEMKGIYSSCVGKDTLDEAPFAYRSMEEIRDVIGQTVKIENVIRPVYNFKAGGR
jgi:RNA-splicing ligase RtcB